MIEEEKTNRVIDLIKNEISKEDFEFFINNANHYSDNFSAYGNQMEREKLEGYFKEHQKKNSLNNFKIGLIFKYLKEFHPNSFRIIPNNIYAFDKNFPNNYNFNNEIQIFRIIELFLE
ncbi:MAG: hypothetical protein O9282_04500 [Flavobacterium sp.]|jgi:hypothetical protein|uniref:hypothetical protein n=1 Tax=Flavobacterium sp. TaxID=239 RepID=UPI0022BB44E6|nr:hypothetical protein [Flavobacterium sp.]MCZ8089986.1 hypothetical protein [Flavobacterium sp.]MCZ8330555.1 hypothetical protein [Flavobacterium sp.]